MVVTAIWVRVSALEPPQLSGERTMRTYDFAGVDVDGQWQVTIERGDAWRVSIAMPTELVDQVRVRRGEGGTGHDGAARDLVRARCCRSMAVVGL